MSVQLIQELIQNHLTIGLGNVREPSLWKIEWQEGSLTEHNDGDHPYGWLIAAKPGQLLMELAEWHFARYQEWTQDDSWDLDFAQGSDDDIQAYLLNAGWSDRNIWGCIFLGTASENVEMGVLNELC